MIIWFTGYSGAGKTTLAKKVEKTINHYAQMGRETIVLDGDILRTGLNSNLKFSPEDRAENIRRTAEVAALISKELRLFVLVALISPMRADRQIAREIAERNGQKFVEVFVDCPLTSCVGRDVKGLYAKALSGEIGSFTGVSAPYEIPENPEIIVHTDYETEQECVDKILRLIHFK